MDTKLLKSINNLIRVVKKKNIVKYIYSGGFYNDEPKIYSFITQLNNINKDFPEKQFSVGSSFSKINALAKNLGEAIERYFLSVYKEDSLVWKSYNNLKKEQLILVSFFLSLNIKLNQISPFITTKMIN